MVTRAAETDDASTTDDAAESSPPAPLPRGLELLRLESRRATVIYWTAMFALVAGLFIPDLLPLVDYPQHLGMAAIARRLADPSAPEHASFTVNYFTYNGLFHFLVAQLGRIFPIETAGRLVVGASLVGLGGGVVALLRTVKRPPSYAGLFAPVLFSAAVGWGFINYALAVALGAWCLVFIVRMVVAPSWRWAIVIGALGLVSGFTHVLGTLLLCCLGLAFVPEIAWRSAPAAASMKEKIRFGLRRGFAALSPLLLGCAWCIAVYVEQYRWNPGSYTDPTHEGTMPPVWHKLLWFTSYTSGIHYDKTDQVLLGVGLVLAVVALALGTRARAEGDRPLYGPFVVGATIYVAIPMVFIGTHIIFPRFGQTVVFGLVFALPRLVDPWRARMRRLSVATAGLVAANLVAHLAMFARETDGLSRMIDVIPEGRRVTAVIYGGETQAFRSGILVHAAGYYGARKRGEWAYNFARYASVPLNFVSGSQPAWPARGWEFAAADYNPHCAYARYYDVVLLRAPVTMAEAPADVVLAKVFGDEAQDVRVLGRDGRYWAIDTAGLPADGTL